MNTTGPRPVQPRIACPSWCDLDAEDFHRSDYDSTTDAGLLARVHSTTVASWGPFAVDLVALETANPDGSHPLVDPASIALYGLEDGPQLTAADALALADALRAAAERLPHLDEGPALLLGVDWDRHHEATRCPLPAFHDGRCIEPRP